MENLRVFCKIVITSQFMRTQKIVGYRGYVMGKNTNIAMEYVIRQTGPYKKQCFALEKIFLT